MKKLVLPLLLAAAAVLPLLAHDAWVDPLGGPVYQILYGHKETESYPAAKVTSLQVLDAGQHFLPYTRQTSDKGVSITPQGKPAMFALEFDNGYWVKDPSTEKSTNVRLSSRPAAERPGLLGSRVFKFSKTMLHWELWMFKPFGQRLEFVPESFTGPLRAGQSFRVRLLLDGQPLAGELVDNNNTTAGPRTDATGLATITLVQGVNRLSSTHDIAQAADPEFTRLSLNASLVFVAE